MTLIVEDGSCVPDAESYASLTDANKYLAERGMTAWESVLDADKEAALRRATDFMVARYRGSWKGAKVKYAQALDWPRVGVNPDDQQAGIAGFGGYYTYVLPYNEIPKEVRHACIELALKAAAGPLVEDLGQKVIQETVGPITTKYDPSSQVTIRYTQVDMMLKPFLGAGGNSAMVKLVRC